MGTDKAFLQLDGRTLLARALDVVRAVTPEFHIVGPRAKFELFGPVVEDIFSDRGPLGGIHAALCASDKELNLVLAVDIPKVDARFLEFILHRAQDSDAVVTVPRAGGGWQPLCAVYRRAFCNAAEQALKQGRNKIDPLFERVSVAVIEESDLKKAGFAESIFRNLNTPAEFEALAKGTR
jgi:molybdopterin-guanine dinucleotide biosynthesis protein A